MYILGRARGVLERTGSPKLCHDTLAGAGRALYMNQVELDKIGGQLAYMCKR